MSKFDSFLSFKLKHRLDFQSYSYEWLKNCHNVRFQWFVCSSCALGYFMWSSGWIVRRQTHVPSHQISGLLGSLCRPWGGMMLRPGGPRPASLCGGGRPSCLLDRRASPSPPGPVTDIHQTHVVTFLNWTLIETCVNGCRPVTQDHIALCLEACQCTDLDPWLTNMSLQPMVSPYILTQCVSCYLTKVSSSWKVSRDVKDRTEWVFLPGLTGSLGLIWMQILTPSQGCLEASVGPLRVWGTSAFSFEFNFLFSNFCDFWLEILLKVEKAYVQIKFIKFGAN